MAPSLVLSLFPGIGLLDRGFEAEGFCVVRGPDLLWGGEVRGFTPPAGCFAGVIGGPPCQDFSSLRRAAPTGQGLEMLAEFLRCVAAADPEWFLLENVARVPDVSLAGYTVQRLDVDLAWLTPSASRLRHIQFGSRSGRLLHLDRRPGASLAAAHRAALANDRRPLAQLAELQGLPPEFSLPGFTREGATRAIGNGVPLPMGRALAAAVRRAYDPNTPPPELQACFDGPPEPAGRCRCGCGRKLPSLRHTFYDASCRKRAQRRRDRLAAALPDLREGSP